MFQKGGLGLVLWLAAALMAVFVSRAAAQGGSTQPPACANKLIPCVNYINATTTPPPECCNSLNETVTNDRECLCSIYNNTNLLQLFKINITQAMNLPKLCHLDAAKNGNICLGTSPSTGSDSTPPARNGSGSCKSSAWRIAVTGLVSSFLGIYCWETFCIFF